VLPFRLILDKIAQNIFMQINKETANQIGAFVLKSSAKAEVTQHNPVDFVMPLTLIISHKVLC